MERVLVSSCLLGAAVRYDGRAKTNTSAILARWRAEGRIVGFCPELAGGLGVPRPPAELRDGGVVTEAGGDVTEAFRRGARQALEAAERAGVKVAVLKEGSPSCGSHQIADGTFTGTKIPGSGITTDLLRAHGIHVFSENELEEADRWLTR
ncbi:uncharacterized protein YbbK (DUF523 family) [Actinocorallia herbida]|uniref:Uncharacterized protein YbbK (DUF523 family) n=1 Tax=Actinocorallia herbida TaxID=58109 RepID=A0A3N1D7D8_9ACTN|nr:DUF523 domain-containing protein [Actinocorallia herbida]ROO89434.1 uncharacterized protein YbbK (DUF523 family) [Actinocorallia herbida]